MKFVSVFGNTQILFVYLTLITISSVTCRAHGHHRKHNHDHNNNEVKSWRQSDDDDSYDTPNNSNNNKKHHHQSAHKHHRKQEEDYEDEGGRHAYVMTTDHLKKPAPEEDQTLTQAFEKHMKPSSNSNLKNPHDVYAYKLPSDLWFIVRYTKNSEGQVEKYM